MDVNIGKIIAGIGGVVLITILIFLVVLTIKPVIDITSTPIVIDTILADNASAQTLSQTPSGSLTVTIFNDTWIAMDGITDRILIPDNSYETISLWVNDSSNNWIHVVNTSGILYEDGVEVSSLTLYPVHEGAGWFIGQTDATTFFAGNIDEVRFFNDTINETIVGEIYADGR